MYKYKQSTDDRQESLGTGREYRSPYATLVTQERRRMQFPAAAVSSIRSDPHDCGVGMSQATNFKPPLASSAADWPR
jgi:hypothetical protein